MTVSNLALDLGIAVVAGAAAGNVTVAGIKTTDKLLAVFELDFNLAEAAPNTRTWVPLTLTSEFSITAANTINNAGGTATTGGILLVFYHKADALGGDLNRS